MKPIFSFLLIISLFPVSYATTYTVITSNANGAGSFIEAIDLSNANPGVDTIAFDIPGKAPHVIPLSTTTSISITDVLHLDGSTQPDNGYTGSCPKIVLDATGVEPSMLFLIDIQAPDVSIYGLWIKNFTNPGSTALLVFGPYTYIGSPDRKNMFTNVVNSIQIAANNVWINANYFGCNCDGTGLEANSGDAIISFTPVANLTIVDNLISGNTNGIYFGTSSDAITNVTIIGNKIGTDITGTTSLGNNIYGITLFNVTNLHLGGEGGFLNGNVISGNGRDGCLLTACSGTVYGNKIGTDITGHDTLPNDPLHTEYNTAFNCNSYPGFFSNLIIGGMAPGQQNIFFGNDIALNVADYSGHYEIINNLIGQTLSGIVSPVQSYGFQMYYDTNWVRLENNYIYGVGAAVYATQSEHLFAINNVLGLDIYGNALSLAIGYSLNLVDSFTLQNNIIRNCGRGIYMYGCNDSYIDLNSIRDCQTPIEMYAAELFNCHHNRLYRNAISFNDYTINLYNGTSVAANDDILPPVIEGSTIDSTWGTALPFAMVDLAYDTTEIAGEPQGFSYPVSSLIADAQGHWVYHSFLDRPAELTAMQTDTNNNSSGFATPLTVGINGPSSNTLRIYPNPAFDFLFIEDQDGTAWTHWQILNSLGAIIEKGNMTTGNTQQINVHHLIPGYYFLKVSSAHHSAVKKWIKM